MARPVIKIEVSSDRFHCGKTLAVRLIKKALHEAGFVDVEVNTEKSELSIEQIQDETTLDHHIHSTLNKDPVFQIEEITQPFK